jgi:hypothetical protein
MQKTETQLQQLVAGTQKDIPATSMVDVNGTNLKQSDVLAKLQGWIGIYQSVSSAKATYETAQQSLKASDPEIHEFIVAYGQALKQVLGKSNPLLADFGLNLTQRKPPSAETQVLATAKRAATRKARQTLGKVQKKSVKGVAVTQVIVPASGPQAVSSDSSQVVNPAPSPAGQAVSESAVVPVSTRPGN